MNPPDRNLNNLFLSFFLFLFFPINIFAQNIHIDDLFQYQFHTYSDKEGLPQNTVRSIITDHQGYLWIGTQDGLARYNGHTWTIVDFPDKQISNFNNQNAVCAASDSSLWFGTRGAGAAVLKHGKWTTYTTASGLPDNRVNFILETLSESGLREMWIATFGGGIAKFNGTSWTHFDKKDGLNDLRIFCLAEIADEKGQSVIWAGHTGGLSYFSKGRWNSLPAGHPINKRQVYHISKSVHNKETILWASTSDGVWKYYKRAWTFLPGSPGNMMLTSSAVSPSDDIELWIGTLGNGLYKYDGRRWTQYSSRNGMKDDNIFSLHIAGRNANDRQIWIGTANAGLHRFKNDQWMLLDKSSGLPHNSVVATLFTEDDRGNPVYWMGTNGGIWRFSKGRSQVFDKKVLASNRILCLFETKNKKQQSVIWAGTDNGLMKYEHNRWLKFRLPFGLSDTWVHSLTETGSGQNRIFWIGTSSGLLRYHHGKWKRFDRTNGLPDNIINCMIPDSDRLWIGTENGLCFLHKGVFRTINEKDGLPHAKVLSLMLGGNSGDALKLWIGTSRGASLLQIQKETLTWKHFNESTEPSLADDNISQISRDTFGRIYFGTNNGIVRLYQTTLDTGRWITETFSTDDGLPTKECNGRLPGTDNFGRLWFGTVKGVVIYNPISDLSQDKHNVLIEEMFVDQTPLDISSHRSLDYNKNNIRFDFTLLSYHREQETLYRTRLSGLDNSFSGWTKNYQAEYRNLAPGDYVFEVWGRNYKDREFKSSEFNFILHKAPWQTWWAWTIYFLFTGTCVYVFLRLRLKLLYRKNIQLEKTIQDRTRELRQTQAQLIHSEKMSALGQMVAGIAHEINNPVAFILSSLEFLKKNLISKNGKTQAVAEQDSLDSIHMCESGVIRIRDIVGHLTKFANLNESDIQTVHVDDTISRTLQLFISPQSQIAIYPTLSPDLTFTGNPTEFSLALRNILINAVHAIQDALKKGVLKERQGIIKIDSAIENDQIRISIQDNGMGIPDDIKNKIFDPFFTTREVGEGRGLGLTETYAVIHKHGGTIEVRSVEGQGAEFILRIPLNLNR